MTEFFLPMQPPTVTAQERRIVHKQGKTIFYNDERLKDAKGKLEAYLAQHIPKEKYIGPVMLIVKWCFETKAKHKDGDYKTSRPDTDNLQKALKDIMTKLGYWTDDALVVSEHVEKFWSDIPGIYIKIEELPENGHFRG